MSLNMQLVLMLDRLSVEYKNEIKRLDELDDLLIELFTNNEKPDLTGWIHVELGIRRQLCECLKLRINHLRKLLFDLASVEQSHTVPGE